MLFVRTQLTQHIQMELPWCWWGPGLGGGQGSGSPEETVSTCHSSTFIPNGDAKGQATGSLTWGLNLPYPVNLIFKLKKKKKLKQKWALVGEYVSLMLCVYAVGPQLVLMTITRSCRAGWSSGCHSENPKEQLSLSCDILSSRGPRHSPGSSACRPQSTMQFDTRF